MLFGSGLLTPAIQSAASSLLADQLPSDWISCSRGWEGPEKPQVWLRELVRKRLALIKWYQRITTNKQPALDDKGICLGDLFSPATFVNALRQQSARLLSCAIDQLSMVCSWGVTKAAGPKNSKADLDSCPLPCVISSLLLQGASYEGILRESAADASELQPAPNVTIGFTQLSGNKSIGYENSNSLSMSIPVYLSPSREYFLMELNMNVAAGERDKWVLAGVALFLSGEE